MNTQENNIPLLIEVLQQYADNTLDISQRARKCYLNEVEKMAGRVTWIHNDELKNHVVLRQLSKSNSRDLLRHKTL